MDIICFTLCTLPLIMSTVHVLLDFDQLIMFTALHVALETCVSNAQQLYKLLFTLMILTSLSDIPLQRHTTPQHVTKQTYPNTWIWRLSIDKLLNPLSRGVILPQTQIICHEMCYITTVVEYNDRKKWLEEIANIFPEIISWINWCDARKCHIFPAFRQLG